MLYNRRCWDIARCTRLEDRKDIYLPNNVSMRLKLTDRTLEIASAGFVSMLALWTSFAGLVFGYHHQLDRVPTGRSCGFVLDQLLDLTMMPTTDLLVRLFAQIHFVANVPNVAHCNGVRSYAVAPGTLASCRQRLDDSTTRRLDDSTELAEV